MKNETPTDISGGASAGATATTLPGNGAEAGDVVVPLADRYEILPRQRFDGTDRPFQDCFRARRTGQTQADFLAVAVGTAPLPRAESFVSMKTIDRAGLQRLLDWGMVEWPGGERRLALIFARAPAPAILKRMDEMRPPMAEDELSRAVLTPIHAVLQDLQGRSLFHGAIRPTNIFYNPAGAGAGMLGECVSALPSFLQPAICEPIERAMAEAAGRGNGTAADDLYALGVTAAILVLGHNPLRGIPDDAVIEAKIDRGSYAAIIGNARIPSGLIEPLRGLLSDDPAQRWTLDDLGKWLAGRRQNPRQPTFSRRGQRPMHIGDREIWSIRGLATAMSRDVPAAARLIENGEIDRWVRRVVGDAACATLIAETVETTPGQGRGGGAFEERLVARVCQVLDPLAPIRFRGRALMPRGIGGALAYNAARGEPVQSIAELLAGQHPQFWLSVQAEQPGDSNALNKTFDQAKGFLEKNGLGYGIERCLYEMVSSAPCLSDMVARLFAATPAALLQALEKVGGNSGKRPTAPLDRHIAAFLAARDRSIGDALINALSTGGDGEKRLAILNILAGIQGRFGPARLPKLADWFASLMGPIIERYHSRAARKRVQKEVLTAAGHGDLRELQKLVDDPAVIARDQANFQQAQVLYSRIAGEAARLTELASNRTEVEHTVGRETAAVVASAVGLLLAGGIVLLEMGL